MKLLLKVMVLALIVLSATSCMKGDDTPQFDFEAQLEKEKPIIRAHVEEHYPGAEESTTHSGIWYEILEEGEPNSYEYKFNNNVNNLIIPTVSVRYKGKLLDGTQFDENKTESGWKTGLDGVIVAWQIAFLPNKIGERTIGGITQSGLQKGTKIVLITPSYYAYGNQARGTIPANSPLIFEIEVVNIED